MHAEEVQAPRPGQWRFRAGHQGLPSRALSAEWGGTRGISGASTGTPLVICRAMIGLLDGLVYLGRVCTVLSKCFVLASPYCLHDGCRKRQQHPHSQLLRFQMGLHKVQTASKCLWSSRSNLVSGSFSRILHCSAVHTRQQWCHSDARSHDITGKSYQEGCWPFLADHQHAAEQCAVRILITPSLHISEFRVCSSYLHR